MDNPKSKENKVVSFLLRALEESFLIVIGIFLALQIDGWADERAERQTLKSDLDFVLEDVKKNEEELLKMKSYKEESIRACTELIDAHNTGTSVSPDVMVKTLTGILRTNKFNDHQNGFDKIKSSALYESNEFMSVRDQIRTYSGILEDLRFSEHFINAYVAALSLEMSKHGALFIVFDYLRMEAGAARYTADIPHFDVADILAENKPLQAVLYKYELDAPQLVKNYDQLLAAGEELRAAIDMYSAGE